MNTDEHRSVFCFVFGFIRVYPCSFVARLLVLVLAFAGLALAQTASEKPNTDVRRVGQRLACKCGCKDSVATCAMLECGFSKPAKERIARMQAAGFSDQQIIDAFVRSGPGSNLVLHQEISKAETVDRAWPGGHRRPGARQV